MPLLLMCGIPGSGKSKRANEIKQYLEEKHQKKVVIINEENLQLIKEESYKDPVQEKYTRAFLKSNVEKVIDAETVVILDSLNYIKGYRYELYCLARTAKTQYCVLYCNTNHNAAWEFNQLNENRFSKDLFDDYKSRMEVPNQKNRWDDPLIELRENEATLLEEIADILLFQAKKSKDPQSTKTEVLHDENFVFEIDKRAQRIIDYIMTIQQDVTFQFGNPFLIEGCKEKLVLNKSLNLIYLKTFKKEFNKIMKNKPLDNIQKIDDAFIIHIQNSLNRL